MKYASSVTVIITVGQVLIAYVLGKSGQSANPIIVNVDPVPYYYICIHLCSQIYQLQT